MEKRKSGGIGLYFVILLVFMIIYAITFSSRSSTGDYSYANYVKDVSDGKVNSVTIVQNAEVPTGKLYVELEGENRSRVVYTSDITKDQELLQEKNVSYFLSDVKRQNIWLIVAVVVGISFVVIMFIVMITNRQATGGSNSKMMNFGKSRARLMNGDENRVTFKDVAGQKEAKYELQEIVDFLKCPEKFTKIGAKIPKGCLLVGPPGTGKTLLARAVAGEAGVSFLHTSGSDFVEMFVGMGAARVRDLFEQGRKSAPCIIFIDELDAVGRSRGSGLGGGHDEREQTLNQMLVEMDGFSTDPGVIVIAATNRPDVLDPALLRPGRFDRQVTVALPDVQERLDILKIHTRKVKLSEDVDLARIARATPGTSGADLANLVNEAALFAARSNETIVNMGNFEEARDKILLGVAKKSVFMTEDEKRATAYHEAGHTLLHYYLKHVDPLHKVTIIPHGQALGLTMSLPEKDQYTIQKSYLLDRIKICMGGYCAEKIVYGETTTGTSNDIKQATSMAHRMVTEWGMSDLGFINLSDEGEPLFLGREITQRKDYSDETARKIDSEMQRILTSCLDETMDILTTHRDQLDKLTEALVERETLDDREIRELFGFEIVQHTTDLR